MTAECICLIFLCLTFEYYIRILLPDRYDSQRFGANLEKLAEMDLYFNSQKI